MEKFFESLIGLDEAQKKTDEQLRRPIRKLDRIGKQLANLGFVSGRGG